MADVGVTSEDLSVFAEARPFKSEVYLSKMGANGAPVPTRRNKTLKQILNQERDAYLQKRGLLDSKKKGTEESTPKRHKTSAVASEEEPKQEDSTVDMQVDNAASSRYVPTYANVQAPPSLLPSKKYCDITGLIAPYTDPKTRLRYHSAEVYDIIKGFVPGVDNTYLALRGDASQLL